MVDVCQNALVDAATQSVAIVWREDVWCFEVDKTTRQKPKPSDFNQPIRGVLEQVIALQIANLPSLDDEHLLQVWIRFARYYGRIRDAERSRRDRTFNTALYEEWHRRKGVATADGSFHWPSTVAVTGDGTMDGGFWPPKGMLDAIGYKVGRDGLDHAVRERLLDYLMTERLPPVASPVYVREWAEANTPRRLQKLAETLAALTRNAKRNQARDFAKAVAEWENDLTYLYDRYYVGRCGFGWPTYS